MTMLHDQGFPNTLGGIGLSALAARFRLRGLTIAVAPGGLAALLVLLVGRTT
jgi:hypothetical protein